MSAGEFVASKYELDASAGGLVLRARVQQETIDATDGTTTNAAPTAAVDLGITAKASKGRREFGVGMRRVRLKLKDGAAAPTDYTGQPLYIPVLTPATYTAWALNSDITYLGTTWTLAEKLPESLK